jgi:glycine betaine/proline transport system ATP-binding protein
VQYGPPEEIVTNPKNDYVRQFVASMNPLNVLTAGTLLRGLAELVREPGDGAVLQLDRAGRCRCRLTAGRPLDLTVEGRPGQFIAYSDGLDPAALPPNAMVTGTVDTPMRVAIMVRQQTRRPLVILDDNGVLLGCVGEHEIYRGMLKQLDLSREDGAEAERVGA